MKLEKLIRVCLTQRTTEVKGEKRLRLKLEETQDQINAILKYLLGKQRKIFQEIMKTVK